jgi:hypothetical protein
MERSEERRYEHLSPFELKNKLVELAKHRGERMKLNAGRGIAGLLTDYHAL